jgi:transposase
VRDDDTRLAAADRPITTGTQLRLLEKTKGRKRHIAVDTLGLLIALGVSAASFADSPIGRQVLDHLAYRTPSVSKARVEGGYNAKIVDHGADPGIDGIDVDVVRRDPDNPGLRVLPHRWVLERTFGWLMLHQRPTRDHETHQESSRTMIHRSIIGITGRTLTGPRRLS